MRITDLDRRRAIKRFPEFQKDLSSYRRIKDPHKKVRKEIELKNKWRFSVQAIELADDVAQFRKDAQTVETVSRITDDPYIIIYEGEEKTPSSLTGKSLYLKVNLKGKTETQIVKDFKQAIKPYKALLDAKIPAETKMKRSRKSDSIKDIWAVYDLFLKNDEDISKTADQYEEDHGRFYDKRQHHIKRLNVAIDNAKEIITSVRKDYPLK